MRECLFTLPFVPIYVSYCSSRRHLLREDRDGAEEVIFGLFILFIYWFHKPRLKINKSLYVKDKTPSVDGQGAWTGSLYNQNSE